MNDCTGLRAIATDGASGVGLAPPELLERALRISAVCGRHGLPVRAAAARFPLGHPAVAAVLLGLRSPSEVHDAVDQFHRPLPAALWDDLREAGLLGADVPFPEGS